MNSEDIQKKNLSQNSQREPWSESDRATELTAHTSLLKCRQLTLGYGSKDLVRDLDYDINAGDYLCIVGRNGSGKTTLLVPSYIIEGTDEDRTDAAYQLFDLASPNVEFKGFTVDFNNRLFSSVSGAFSVNPAGKILDCVFENCKSGRVKSVFFIQITAGVSPVFSNCVFRNIHTHQLKRCLLLIIVESLCNIGIIINHF